MSRVEDFVASLDMNGDANIRPEMLARGVKAGTVPETRLPVERFRRSIPTPEADRFEDDSFIELMWLGLSAGGREDQFYCVEARALARTEYVKLRGGN